MYLTNHKSKSHRRPCTIQQKTRNDQDIVEIIKLKNGRTCIFGFSRKWIVWSSHMFFMMRCFMMSFLFRLTLVSFVSNSTTASITFSMTISFRFVQAIKAHYMLEPSSSCIFMLYPLLKILWLAPMSWHIIIKLWVELETTILLTTTLAFISSKLWLALIPC
jgi:hypothetical protein